MSIDEVLANQRPWWIEQGDALFVLKTMPDECVNIALTSPPYYALRSYLNQDSPLKAMELGSEKIPDCQGWATGQLCGNEELLTLREDLTDEEVLYVYSELRRLGLL